MSSTPEPPRPGEKIGTLTYTGVSVITDEKTIAVTLGKAISMLADIGLGVRLDRNFRHGPRNHPPRPRGVRQPARNP